MSNDKSTHPKIVDKKPFHLTDSVDPMRRYRHLIVLVVVWMVLVLMFSVLASQGGIDTILWAVPCLISLTVSTVVIVAVWTAFGPGRYLKRVAWTHFLGAFVGFAFFLSVIGQSDMSSLLIFSLTIASLIPTVSIAAQIPHLIFRVIPGWQFVYREDCPVEPFALRDVFSFMFVMAIGLTAPQLAWSIGGVGDEFGSFGVMFIAWFSLLSFCASLLALPIVLAVFKSETLSLGIVQSIAYMFLVALGTGVLFFSFEGPGDAIGPALLLVIGYCIAIMIPLSLTRAAGFRLTSMKREPKERTTDASIGLETSHKPKQVHPLDD